MRGCWADDTPAVVGGVVGVCVGAAGRSVPFIGDTITNNSVSIGMSLDI